MKIFLFCLVTVFAITDLCGQVAESTPAEKLAHHIANKISDTLHLSPAQTEQLYEVNMQLHQLKSEVRKKQTQAVDVTRDLQKVENTRDQLYKKVLSKEQYSLYIEKKRYLVSAN